VQLAGLGQAWSNPAYHRHWVIARTMNNQERPWLAHYPAGVPAQIDIDQFRSIAQVLETACDRFAHRPAFAKTWDAR
jgi:hypothetical protein